MKPSALQIGMDASVAIDAVVGVIELDDLRLHFCFAGEIFCFTLLSIVVVSIWINIHLLQQPTDAENVVILFDESISR